MKPVHMPLVAALLALLANVAVAQSPPNWLLEKTRILEATRNAACPDPARPLQCAQALRAAAESRLAAGLPWSSDLFEEAARGFVRVNSLVDAISVYGRLEAHGETAHMRAYASWRAGELLVRVGDDVAALAAFERTIVSIEAQGIASDPRLYADAWLSVAGVHRGNGDLLAAIDARARILNQPWTEQLDVESHIGMAHVLNARDHFALGHIEMGRSWLDSFLAGQPVFGAADGRRVLLMLERALAGRDLAAINDAATVQELASLWTNPAWNGLPEIMTCAANLATVRRNRGEHVLLRNHLEMARARFNANEVQWKAMGGDRFAPAVEDFAAITVEYMAALMLNHEWATAHQVGSDLLNRYPKIEERAFVAQMIAEAAEHLP